jgi:hypothetical protein
LNIELSLESLISSKLIEEVIIVNQGTKNFLQSYEGGKIKVLNVPYSGPLNQSWLLNLGLKASTDEYFMRHDIDCILQPDFDEVVHLGKAVIHQKLIGNIVQDENQYGPKSPSFLPLQERNKKWFKFCRNLNWEKFSFQEFMDLFLEYYPDINVDYLSSHIICKAEYLKKIHGYDESFDGWGCQDTDLNNRLSLAGYKHESPEGLRVLHQPHGLKTVVLHEQEKNHVKARILCDQNRFRKTLRPNKVWGEKEPQIQEHPKIDQFLREANGEYEQELIDELYIWLEGKTSKKPNTSRAFYKVVQEYYQVHGLYIDFSYQEFLKNDLLFQRKSRSKTSYWNVFDEIYKLRLYYDWLIKD